MRLTFFPYVQINTLRTLQEIIQRQLHGSTLTYTLRHRKLCGINNTTNTTNQLFFHKLQIYLPICGFAIIECSVKQTASTYIDNTSSLRLSVLICYMALKLCCTSHIIKVMRIYLYYLHSTFYIYTILRKLS